jgi:TPR repeat protein
MRVMIILMLLLLAGCGTTYKERGEAAYRAGNHDLAIQEYAKCAKNGDPSCQNYIGVYLYQHNEKQAAAQYFRAAAAQGHQKARSNLIAMGEPIPQPTQEAATSTGSDLMQLLGGIGRGVSESTRRSRNCTSMVTGDIVETSCR